MLLSVGLSVSDSIIIAESVLDDDLLDAPYGDNSGKDEPSEANSSSDWHYSKSCMLPPSSPLCSQGCKAKFIESQYKV